MVTVDGYRAQCMVAFRRPLSNYDSLLVADTHKRIREYQFGSDNNVNESNGVVIESNDSVTGISGLTGGFASTVVNFENIGTSLTGICRLILFIFLSRYII